MFSVCFGNNNFRDLTRDNVITGNTECAGTFLFSHLKSLDTAEEKGQYRTGQVMAQKHLKYCNQTFVKCPGCMGTLFGFLGMNNDSV